MSSPAEPDIDAILMASLADHQLSRSERQALTELFAGLDPSLRNPADLRRRAIDVAQKVLERGNGVAAPLIALLEWLRNVFRSVDRLEAAPAAHAGIAEAHFSPGDDCRVRIAQLLDAARRSVDVCVFTITDDRISRSIVAAHRRGVAVRILTDNEKADDLGSDVREFRREGIPLRVDHTPAHMHHKFAVFDGSVVLTGSYNWTRAAASENHENLVVSGDPRLVAPFARTFERLWQSLA